MFQVNFGTDGEIVGLTETEETAEGVKYTVHDFIFGANGDLMKDKVRQYTVYANGTTSPPVEYTLTADDGPAYENVQSILTFLEDNYTGHTSDYYLNGDTTGVGEAVEEAEGKITDSQGKEGLGDYELDAKTDGVQTGVETAQQIIETGIANTDTTFHLKTVYDGTPQPPKNPTTPSEDIAAFGNLLLGMFTDPEKAAMDYAKYRAEAELRNASTYNEVPELTRGGKDLPSVLYTLMWDAMESKGYPVPDFSDPNSIIIEPSGNFDSFVSNYAQGLLNGTVPVDPDYTPPLQEYYPWTPFFDSIRERLGLPRRMPKEEGPIKLDPVEPADSFEEGTGLFGGLYKIMKQALDSKGIEVGLEVTPDESSAEEAATEAADIA